MKTAARTVRQIVVFALAYWAATLVLAAGYGSGLHDQAVMFLLFVLAVLTAWALDVVR